MASLSRQVCLACRRSIRTQQTPVASTSTLRPFSTSRSTQLKLTADKLEKDDPRDMDNLEDFMYDDIPWYGHLQLEKDREKLHLLRLIEFQFPEFEKLHVEYEPKKDNFVKVRSVFRLGDPAPAESRKAVLKVSIGALTNHGGSVLASEEALHKVKLLAGPRWDPSTNTIKISCDNYPTHNMNSKWCSDALDRLISAANDTSDPMTDIPLDTSHVRSRERREQKRSSISKIPADWLPPRDDAVSELQDTEQ